MTIYNMQGKMVGQLSADYETASDQLATVGVLLVPIDSDANGKPTECVMVGAIASALRAIERGQSRGIAAD